MCPSSSAHSTRSTSTTTAAAAGVSAPEIMEWAQILIVHRRTSPELHHLDMQSFSLKRSCKHAHKDMSTVNHSLECCRCTLQTEWHAPEAKRCCECCLLLVAFCHWHLPIPLHQIESRDKGCSANSSSTLGIGYGEIQR